jgi:hypothetical protein
MYSVAPSLWVRVSSIHVSLGLQTMESQTRITSLPWSEFCTMILSRFGQDQHELLIRQRRSQTILIALPH